MPDGGLKTLQYARAHFTTRLPVDYLYSRSHAWMARQDADYWRVGLTRFATRMLGEIVDHGFEVAPETAVHPGMIVGWIEGFKAISDLYCIAEGQFAGGNPTLQQQIALVNQDPYDKGWLYLVKGRPGAECVDVQAYSKFLDETIDRLQAERRQERGA